MAVGVGVQALIGKEPHALLVLYRQDETVALPSNYFLLPTSHFVAATAPITIAAPRSWRGVST